MLCVACTSLAAHINYYVCVIVEFELLIILMQHNDNYAPVFFAMSYILVGVLDYVQIFM